jgi:glycosyltransferase involved in cell wall biosynthesis
LDVEDHVVFTGYVPEEELPYLFSAADVFVYPSFYEGFGIPPLEAMACGIPVVTSNVSSLPEVVGDAGLLVDPQNTDEIAGAIIRALTDEALRSDLAKRGRKRRSLFLAENHGANTGYLPGVERNR